MEVSWIDAQTNTNVLVGRPIILDELGTRLIGVVEEAKEDKGVLSLKVGNCINLETGESLVIERWWNFDLEQIKEMYNNTLVLGEKSLLIPWRVDVSGSH